MLMTITNEQLIKIIDGLLLAKEYTDQYKPKKKGILNEATLVVAELLEQTNANS